VPRAAARSRNSVRRAFNTSWPTPLVAGRRRSGRVRHRVLLPARRASADRGVSGRFRRKNRAARSSPRPCGVGVPAEPVRRGGDLDRGRIGRVAPLTADRRRWASGPPTSRFATAAIARRIVIRPSMICCGRSRRGSAQLPAESLTLSHAVRGERLVEIEDQMADASLGYFYALCGISSAWKKAADGPGGPRDRTIRRRVCAHHRLARTAASRSTRLVLFWSGDRVLEDPVSFKRLAPQWFRRRFGQPRAPADELTARDKNFACRRSIGSKTRWRQRRASLHERTRSPNLCLAGASR